MPACPRQGVHGVQELDVAVLTAAFGLGETADGVVGVNVAGLGRSLGLGGVEFT